MNSKKARVIPPSPRIRKVWISKQYLTYKNGLTIERGVSAIIENKKNGGHSNHSSRKHSMGVGQEAKNKKFSKENNASQKETCFSKKKSMNDPLNRKMSQKFITPLTILPSVMCELY